MDRVAQLLGGDRDSGDAGAPPPHPRPRLKDASKGSGGAWASRHVVTQGRSTEPPGPQHPPEQEPNANLDHGRGRMLHP